MVLRHIILLYITFLCLSVTFLMTQNTCFRLSQPWRIVLPSLIFNITFLGIALAAACKLHDGISVFCNFFQDDMDETK